MWYLHIRTTRYGPVTTFGPFIREVAPPNSPTIITSSTGWTNKNVTISLKDNGDNGSTGFDDTYNTYSTYTSGSKDIQWGYSIDPWKVYDGAYTETREGWRTVAGRTIDNLDLISTVTNVSFGIDKTAPIGIFNPNSASWTKNNMTVKFTPSDNLSGVKQWRYSISTNSGLSWGGWSSYYSGARTQNITLSTEGNNRIRCEIIDNASNVGTVTSGTYSIDKTVPSGIFNPNSTSWTKNNTTVKFTPSDNLSGVKQWRYSISTNNGSTWGGWSAYYSGTTAQNITLSTEGNNRIRCEIIDNASNVGMVTSGTYSIDKTVPGGSFNPNSVAWTKNNVTVKFTPLDNLSGVKQWRYSISTNNGTSWGGWSSYYIGATAQNITLSNEGVNKIRCELIDNASNVGTVTSGTYSIDRTAPIGNVKYDFNDEEIKINIKVENVIEIGSGVKDVWVEYSPKDSSNTIVKESLNPKPDGTFEVTTDLFDKLGSSNIVNLVVKAEDKVGNIGILGNYEIDMFKVEATIERVLEPHTPNFMGGEKGVLKIKLYGGVDKYKITFPKGLVELDSTLNAEINITPQRITEVEYDFFIPLETLGGDYSVTVNGYKNGDKKTVNPKFTVNGAITDNLRTRIRIPERK